VVLTGTQLGSYGFDLPDIDLAGLLGRVLAETDVERLRVSSLQPQEIDAKILELWRDRRLCPHFHLALQSGSDGVLRRMRRRYTARQYEAAIEMIRSAVPGVSVTADVIVGFPAESEEDFRQTHSLCDRAGFAAMHVFPYSVRPGTSAAHFAEVVDAGTKAARMASLLALSRRHAAAFRAGLLGTTRPVLWEGRTARGGGWSGLTDNYVRVVGHSPRSLSNRITPALLRERDGDLVLSEVLG
jgi:threonylcarbamoyladenosine tRNA methylthiotransferase MtaB